MKKMTSRTMLLALLAAGCMHAQANAPQASPQQAAALTHARDNLILARGDLEGSHYKAAQSDLNVASKALAHYISLHGPHAAEAKSIRAEIESANGATAATTHATLLAKIDQWWNAVSKWSSPAAPALSK